MVVGQPGLSQLALQPIAPRPHLRAGVLVSGLWSLVSGLWRAGVSRIPLAPIHTSATTACPANQTSRSRIYRLESLRVSFRLIRCARRFIHRARERDLPALSHIICHSERGGGGPVGAKDLRTDPGASSRRRPRVACSRRWVPSSADVSERETMQQEVRETYSNRLPGASPMLIPAFKSWI